MRTRVLLSILLVCVLGCKAYREIRMNEGARKYEEAQVLMGQKQYAAARDAFTAAGLAEFDKTASLTGVVQCDFMLGDDAELRADAAALFRLPNGKGEALFWLGQMCRRNRQYPQAEQYLDQAARNKHPTAVHAIATMRKEMMQ